MLIGGGEVAVAPAATAGEPEGKIEVSITPENIVEEVIAARAAISGSSTSSSSSFAATSQPEAEEKSSAASYDRSDLVSVRDIVNPADDGPVQRAAVDSGFPLRGEKSDSAEIEQPPKPVMPDGYIEAAPSEPAPASGVPSRGYSFLSAFDYPASTFSIAVDSVSYPRIRHQLRSGRLPHPSDVRIEEILNYFGYDNPEPAGNRPASLKGEIAPCPWEPDNRLVRIALQGRDLAADERPPANLTVLVDASESMESAMPMVRSALAVLVPKLQAEDRISVLTYGGGPGVVLPTTSGDEPAAIRAAIGKLEAANPAAAAAAAGSASLPAAYTAALGGFSKGGANSVIPITDGDFNLGVIDAERLVTLIRELRRLRLDPAQHLRGGDAASSEAAMEVLACAEYHYRFLDSAEEAQRAFSDELGASLVTVAADAKVQVHFNPAEVRQLPAAGLRKPAACGGRLRIRFRCRGPRRGAGGHRALRDHPSRVGCRRARRPRALHPGGQPALAPERRDERIRVRRSALRAHRSA
ncbi:MAG: von Willebrand factor type A domain-containing protein [Verrucomicrobiales bacterium]